MGRTVVGMTGTEANICYTPRAVSAVRDSLKDTGDAVTLLKLLFEILGLLCEL